ncbi:MAG TPA: carboxypeptidase regulatory-like domain-containing protein [Planctomycetota bacterium]|nr:carboxypeptidase regulatory-like domain-containing protein [Planctomycetota bacterium]
MRRLSAAVLLAMLAGAAAAEDALGPEAAPSAPPADGVRVVDGSGRDLADVHVVEAPIQPDGRALLDADAPAIARSDARGRIVPLPTPSSARVRLALRRDGHEATLLPPTAGRIVVMPKSATLTGTVARTDGPPPARAHVVATPVEGGAFVHVVRLDERGGFQVATASPGRWRLDLRRVDGAWAVLGVATAGVALPPVTLARGALVRGRVMDGDARRSAAGLRLRFRRHDADVPPSEAPVAEALTVAETVCAADGRFAVADLPPGVYAASLDDGLRAWDGPPPRFEISIPVPVRLETWWVVRRGSVTGVVKDMRDRRPVADAQVLVVAAPDAVVVEGGRVPAVSMRTGGDGKFVLAGVAPGAGYRVVVQAAGRSPVVTTPFEVLGGRETQVGTIVLARAWRLQATVVGPEGRPVEGATVTASPAARPAPEEGDPIASSVVRTATTDAEGRAVLPDLAAGDARLRIAKAGFVDGTVLVEESGPDAPRDVRVTLAASAAIEGRLEPTEGSLPAVVVRARPRDGSPTRVARPEADGRFRVDDLAPSPVDLEVVAAEGPTGLVYARREAVIPGSGESVVIPVPGARRVSGVVEGVRIDAPPTVVRLEAARFEPSRGDYRATVVAEVRLAAGSGAVPFAFASVPPGLYALRAVQGRRDTGPVPTSVEGGEVGGVSLLLPEGGEIGGQVWDVVRDTPALGARVELVRVDGEEDAPAGSDAPPALTTDETGRFTARDVAPGLWRVDARDEEAVAAPVVVRLAEGETIFVRDLRLSGGGRVAGRVADPRRGPVGGLSVRIARGSDLQEVTRALTDDDGEFRSSPLAAGRYRLRVAAGLPAEGVLEADVDVVDGETTRVVWAPTDVGRIDGTVRRRGTAIAGVTVEAAFAGGAGVERVLLRTVTDAFGQFAWDGLAEGEYQLRLLDGVVRGRATVRLGRGERVTRELDLGEGRLVGTVTSPDGSPWRGVEIVAMPLGTAIDLEDAETGRVRTGPDGAFAISGLPVGRYRVAVLPPGRPARVFDGIFAELPGSERPLDVVLGVGATIELDVRDPGGRGVAAAEVWVEDGEGNALHPRPFATPGSGRLRIEGVPDGPLRVVVHARGYGRPRPARITARDGSVSAVRVSLTAAGSVRLVVSAGRDPVPRARVEVRRRPDGEVLVARRPLRRGGAQGAGTATSDTGELLIEDLEEGDYDVQVTAGRELEAAQVVVRVRAGTVTEARVALRFAER